MRYALIGSILFHIVILGFVIFNFTSRGKEDAPPPVPVAVDVMAPKDLSERQAGKADGVVEKPALPALVKAPETEASAKKEIEQKPSPKPAEKEALPPPAPPKVAEAAPPAPKPAEPIKAEPAAEKPVEKPAPKPAPKKEVARKPAPKPKPEEPKREESKPAPERSFDPNGIASLLQKHGAQPQQTSQPAPDTPPAKTYSDRQTAVLNRDPNAGTPSGAYDPSRPWRPQSSLQDQAMGLQDARGPMNSGSCADLVQSRIEQNWTLPIGAQSGETIIVRLHIELNRDGRLLRPPTVMDAATSPSAQAMADAAVRAALQAQPFPIPSEQYERCRDMILRFNPRDMYGG